jgi:hypothetical protein
MAAPTAIYVNSDIGANSGAGTSGDPYGDVQYALDTCTPDGTNGNIFYGKGTDTLVAALTIAGYQSPSYDTPLIFARWDADWYLSGGGSVAIWNVVSQNASPWFFNMRMGNCGAANIITLPAYSGVMNCEIDTTTGHGIVVGARNLVSGCNIYNIAGQGVRAASADGCAVLNNYFKNSTNDFTRAIYLDSLGCRAEGNIISIDGSSWGIELNDSNTPYGRSAIGNSILSAGGTGTGISISASDLSSSLLSNLVEGFSGGGGKGFDFVAGGNRPVIAASNAAYNNATNYANSTFKVIDLGDYNEALGATPFDKSGADTFANRFTYFAPAATGSVRAGAYPTGSRRDKGAVQHADPAGGSGGGPLMFGRVLH